MNIFVLDENPRKAAEMLCDCHVRKMCVETAQILSGVMIRRKKKLLDGMPEPQNINHPVIVAASENEHYALDWVVNYNDYLHDEYRKRFGKYHAYAGLALEYVIPLWDWTDGECEYLCKCCGDLDVADMDIVTAYRKYYTEVKKPTLTEKKMWKFTKREDWTE
jgi:hypothetical protein